jgi:siroheme synthase-like protein
MAFTYPVVLDLSGVPVLVVGGGRVAVRKATGLARAGALVTVVAPEHDPAMVTLAARIEQRQYQPGEAADYQLVITATDDPAVNELVAADARAARVWVNSADDPDNCSFILPAVARQGDVTVAVTTGGASPALASRLRDEIAAAHLSPRVAEAAVDLARQRAEIHAAGASTEEVDWSDRLDAALRDTD